MFIRSLYTYYLISFKEKKKVFYMTVFLTRQFSYLDYLMPVFTVFFPPLWLRLLGLISLSAF